MTANVFEVFMSEHEPVSSLVNRANAVLWDENALHPVIKERMRISLAKEIGCAYCARFRTDDDGTLIVDLDGELSAEEQQKAALVERYAAAAVAGGGEAPDALTVEVQEHFDEAEFTDLIFSMGWFIGMQFVGRLMHWDNACPVAPIRDLVEAGEAA